MATETTKLLYRTFAAQTNERIIQELEDDLDYESARQVRELDERLRQLCTEMR